MAYTYKYPRAAVTVDPVVFGYRPGDDLQVLLVERGEKPYKGRLAFPGGHLNVTGRTEVGETPEAAAYRELREETGIEPDHLEQLYTFGGPFRDPRGYYITIAYMALVRSVDHVAKPGSDARAAGWYPVSAVLPVRLAFDHSEILAVALRRLQAKVRYAPIGFHLLPEKFTLRELQALYEAVLMRQLDRANFRRSVNRMNRRAKILVEAGTHDATGGRPAALYRFDRKAYDKAARVGFSFEL